MELRRQAFDRSESHPVEVTSGRFRNFAPALYFGGRTRLSDHARQQLGAGLRRRSIRYTLVQAGAPFTESCVLPASTTLL